MYTKAIAIKVDDALIRQIHVRAAERGLSMQSYINSLIQHDLHPSTPISPEQTKVIRDITADLKQSVQQLLGNLAQF